MNVRKLRLTVRRSAETNDSETRILIDGEDWLGEGYLGLDPPDLIGQLAVGARPRRNVGRCLCGAVGCDDLRVALHRDDQHVRWSLGEREVVFDAADYDAELTRLAGDHSWEDDGRRAERLVGEVMRGAVLEDGASFMWASTRIARGTVHLSFERDEAQVLLEFGWDGADVEAAVRRARWLRRERCEDLAPDA